MLRECCRGGENEGGLRVWVRPTPLPQSSFTYTCFTYKLYINTIESIQGSARMEAEKQPVDWTIRESLVACVINFMGQLDQANECPDIQLNILLAVSMRVFLKEISI